MSNRTRPAPATERLALEQEVLQLSHQLCILTNGTPHTEATWQSVVNQTDEQLRAVLAEMTEMRQELLAKTGGRFQ